MSYSRKWQWRTILQYLRKGTFRPVLAILLRASSGTALATLPQVDTGIKRSISVIFLEITTCSSDVISAKVVASIAWRSEVRWA